LVSLYSTIKMMHGPVNRRFKSQFHFLSFQFILEPIQQFYKIPWLHCYGPCFERVHRLESCSVLVSIVGCLLTAFILHFFLLFVMKFGKWFLPLNKGKSVFWVWAVISFRNRIYFKRYPAHSSLLISIQGFSVLYSYMAKVQGRIVTNVIAFMKFLYKFLMYPFRPFYLFRFSYNLIIILCRRHTFLLSIISW